jgi:hypothetical protein
MSGKDTDRFSPHDLRKEKKMKRLLMLQVLAFSLMCMFGISSAAALGLGGYYNLGWGDGEIEYDDDYYDHEFDIEPDYKTKIIGFMLDTNVARDSVFNYRLNIALDKLDFGGRRSKKIDGYVMDHTFGFGVLRNQYVRLWLGPQISLSYYNEDDFDFDLFGLGFGPAVGVNIHAGDKVSFTVTSGYKYNLLFGSDFRDDFTGYEGQYYINFGVLFRINDVYPQ